MGSGQGSEVNAVSTFLSSSFFFLSFSEFWFLQRKMSLLMALRLSIYLFVHLDNSNTTNFPPTPHVLRSPEPILSVSHQQIDCKLHDSEDRQYLGLWKQLPMSWSERKAWDIDKWDQQTFDISSSSIWRSKWVLRVLVLSLRPKMVATGRKSGKPWWWRESLLRLWFFLTDSTRV